MKEIDDIVEKFKASIGTAGLKSYLSDRLGARRKELSNYSTSLASDRYYRTETMKEIKYIEKLLKKKNF